MAAILKQTRTLMCKSSELTVDDIQAFIEGLGGRAHITVKIDNNPRASFITFTAEFEDGVGVI